MMKPHIKRLKVAHGRQFPVPAVWARDGSFCERTGSKSRLFDLSEDGFFLKDVSQFNFFNRN